MTAWNRLRPLRGLLVAALVLLAGCAALADPVEEELVPSPASPSTVQPGVVVLPVFNDTGRTLRLSGDERLGHLEPIFSPRDALRPTVAELIQAGFILGLDAAGRSVATMAWTNDRVPVAPASLEAAWELASAQRFQGEIAWIALTAWDDNDWRQRGTITISAEVARFASDDPAASRVRVFRRHRMVIPPFSSRAQAAGHVGLRLAQLTATP